MTLDEAELTRQFWQMDAARAPGRKRTIREQRQGKGAGYGHHWQKIEEEPISSPPAVTGVRGALPMV